MKPGAHVPHPASRHRRLLPTTPAGQRPTQRPPQIEYLRLSRSPESMFTQRHLDHVPDGRASYRGPRMPRPDALAICSSPSFNPQSIRHQSSPCRYMTCQPASPLRSQFALSQWTQRRPHIGMSYMKAKQRQHIHDTGRSFMYAEKKRPG